MMDCNNSMAPNDEELLSYALDDEPLPREKEGHLAYCFICQQRLNDYKQTHEYLLTKLYRTQCPSATKLNYYCAGLSTVGEVPKIKNHLLVCPLCASEVTIIQQTLANFDPFPSEEETSAMSTTVRRIIASPVPQRRIPATRGVALRGGWSRQYRAEALSILLDLSHARDGDTLLFAAFSNAYAVSDTETFEGIIVDLYRAADFQLLPNLHSCNNQEDHCALPLQTTQIDDLGNSVFSAIPAGEYTMIVHLLGRDIIIEGLSIS